MPKAEKLISYSSNLQDAILHVVLYRIVDYIPLLQPSGLQKISIQYTPQIYCFTRKAEIYAFKTGPHLPSCYVYMLLVLFSRPLRKLIKIIRSSKHPLKAFTSINIIFRPFTENLDQFSVECMLRKKICTPIQGCSICIHNKENGQPTMAL